ncbi:MAG TPA: oligopeptide transporter, OPT family [Pyrinomonadaceae bacterium]|jgi:putative OPT family oligopeptide transporter|nr:oligopeptide transporter, OPT family [Pyrinomonadaceae bacterium]
MSIEVDNERAAAAAAQEYPDRTGWTPDNPYLAAYRPYIPSSVHLRELTPLPLIMGTLLGIIFGASSLYLVLKVGLTVSASIPVAVISITLFRLLSKMGLRDATILENNIVQTAGSAGESIAFGLGVTMPAILILGFDLEITRVMLVAVLGGLLGILMMIPLRRALIVQQHGYLKYPEGTACAEVLKAGASEESRAAAHTDEASAREADNAMVGGKTIITGFGIGFLYYGLQQIFKTWKEIPEKVFGRPFDSASISVENNPALLGVGYIIGPRIAGFMMGGGVLAYLVLIPAIRYFGGGLAEPLAPETAHRISEMTVSQIQKAYILYIGAGAVAAGGIISLFRSLPVIWSGLKGGLADLRGSRAQTEAAPRIDRDLSMKFVIGGVILLVIAIMAFPQLGLQNSIAAAPVGALLIVIFGFLFVTVSSRLTGEVGSSSNPISGMTVATLLLTCLAFLIVGWTAPPFFVTALSIGGIVCIAASNGGTTSQDLKTGFLVGSTPKAQQIAILVGALSSALVLGYILMWLNQSATVYVPVNDAQVALAPSYRFDPNNCEKTASGAAKREGLMGAQASQDSAQYLVCHKTDTTSGPTGRYLVRDDGTPVYLADPGINGVITKRPGGGDVTKYNAPKATLMSYIIKGILSGQLPWGLVLLGVFIAIVLELSGIPSLAFAVGVYLPISTSAPIFVGGLVRLGVDKYTRRKFAGRKMTEEQLTAEGDKSSGVLLASGYIAGGALAGVVHAFLNLKEDIALRLTHIEEWAKVSNPFFDGPGADILALIPLAALTILLYAVGREWLFAPRGGDTPPAAPPRRRET